MIESKLDLTGIGPVLQVAFVEEEGGAIVGAGFCDAESSLIGVSGALAGLAIKKEFPEGPFSGFDFGKGGLPEVVFDEFPSGDELAAGNDRTGAGFCPNRDI